MRDRPRSLPLRHALSWAELWPSVRGGFAVLLLFAIGVWLARHYAVPVRDALTTHSTLGLALFFVSSVVAVLLPMLSNLPLLPLAVLAWGPWGTAAVLLLGWVGGAALSFSLGRHAQPFILRHFPGVQRHAQIDRLIHPRHRMGSLILLRMTFPVDVLSYALGLFSQRTTLVENLVSTLLGATPFALVFAFFPTLSGPAQLAVFFTSVALFAPYAWWVLRRTAAGADESTR